MRRMANMYDAVIVGSGPNGLAAGIRLAEERKSVVIIEEHGDMGGGVRTRPLTLPDYLSDTGSAIHPMAIASPFFRRLPLERYGLSWIHSPLVLAHPLDGGKAVTLRSSVLETAKALGIDGHAWMKLFSFFASHHDAILDDILSPRSLPKHPTLFLRFGLSALRSIHGTASCLTTEASRALYAGIGAHAIQPFRSVLSSAAPLALTIAAHGRGWPFPRGGASALTHALVAHFQSLGGEVLTNTTVSTLSILPPSRVVLFATSPSTMCRIAGALLPSRYREQIERYRYGPGVFKMDWALDGPIPWRSEECRMAATVHVGGRFEEIMATEDIVHEGKIPETPFIILAQQSLFDSTRAPAGSHVAWGYCHVPNGCDVDMTARMERQIERFAPGFRDRILARHSSPPSAIERESPNNIGGDIAGGALDWRQLFFRPSMSLCPYRTPNPRFYLCSSATPPGPGVHGMCGFHAAECALRTLVQGSRSL